MNFFLIVLLLCLLMGCTPKNIYYNNHLSDSAYNIFFEAKQESPAYKVSGANMIAENIFNAVLPDSLGGAFNTGQCVVEIQRNDMKNQITDIRLVGITIYNKQTDIITGFDRYHQTLKRVRYEPSDNVKIYIPFIKQIAEKWTYHKSNSTTKTKDFAYCKIIFGSNK